MWKIRSFYFVSFLFLWFGKQTLKADGSPIIQSMAAQGNCIFICESRGLYTLCKEKDQFSWHLESGHYPLTQLPNGKIWSIHVKNSKSGYYDQIRGLEGDTWIVYTYPLIKQSIRPRFFFVQGKTLLITEAFDSEEIVVYEFVVSQWKKQACFPEKIRLSHSNTSLYVNNDTIFLNGLVNQDRRYLYYYYSTTTNEWKKMENEKFKPNSLSEPTIWGRGYKQVYDQSSDNWTLTSPEGNPISFGMQKSFASFDFDTEGYCYLQLSKRVPDKKGDVHQCELWTDRSGEWKEIARVNRELTYTLISGDSEQVIWGSDSRSYIGYLQEGRWIEVAMMPPELDCRCGDEDEVCKHPMYERFSDADDMQLGVINDPDGYVNVRSNPGIHSPIVAVVLKNIEFLYKPTNHPAWSKVLLPSGTTGFMSSSRIRKH